MCEHGFRPTRTNSNDKGCSRMNAISKSFAILVLVTLGARVAGATTLTYTFTGVVTNAQGSWATYNGQTVIGDTVTGTYVFNYSAAIPSQSAGTPGNGGPPNGPGWGSYSDFPGNFPSGGSLSGNLVFTSTAQVTGTNISYATTAPSPGYDIGSYAVGYDNGGSEFQASEQANQANGGDTQSTFGIGGSIPGQVFDANGGPVYPSSLPLGAGSGDFAVTTGGSATNVINYDITSISPATPVPLPASVWLMLSGVAALGATARRRTV